MSALGRGARAARGAAALLAGGLALGARGVAFAGSGAALGEEARGAALAGAVTARPGEASSVADNPGALADVERGIFHFTFHAGALGLGFQRTGEERLDLGRTLAGFGGAVAARLPGPEWLRAFRVGLAVNVPASHALRLEAPSRLDEPSFALYGSRAERTAVAGTLAVKLFDRIGVGIGVALTPSLYTPTLVRYVPGRGTPAENVVVDLERQLHIGLAAMFGVKTELADEVSLGFAYRQEMVTRAFGPNDTQAGTLVVNDDIDFHDFLAPDELATGVAVTPDPMVTVSLDAVLARWSRYRTIHDATPRPGLSDVVNVRAGAEIFALPELAVRFGYGFEPTPVPEQTGATNLLDASRHVWSAGLGYDLDRAGLAPVRLDAYVRGHVLGTQRADKNLAELGDASPSLHGRQIDNLGYPGFEATGLLVQAGVTVSVYLSEPDAPATEAPAEPAEPAQPEAP
ncbi:MAG: outer membrane protein transport protein [Polyangiaceae bacterium]|nr:outer membrane protein transport protein [Polyangiaceae bacterium]